MVRRATRSAARATKKSFTIDFTGVESRVTIPEGDYSIKVKEVTREVGDKADYFKWVFEVTGPKHEGATLYNNTSLATQSLWALRNLLETLGVDVPDGPLELEVEELVGLECGAVVTHEEYEGKIKARISDFYPLEGATEAEKPTATKAGKKAETTLDKLKSDDVAEMGEDELVHIVEKYKLGIDLDAQKSLRKKANATLDALEAKGFLEDE